jgi:hypothetical protein
MNRTETETGTFEQMHTEATGATGQWSAHRRIDRKTRTYESAGCLFTITTVCDSAAGCDLCETHAYYAAEAAMAEGRPVYFGKDGHGATVHVRAAD